MNIFMMVDLPEAPYHDLTCYFTWMGWDGIMRTKVKPGARIELEHAKENSQVINSYSAVAKFPLIVDTTDIYYMSKEARDFLSLRGRESVVNSIAIIRKSLIGNMIANFYIGLNKPTVPTRLFTNEEEAIKWCEKYKETINAV